LGKNSVYFSKAMTLIANLAADLQFALRMTRKSIGFTLAAVLSLALGIGASSAIFSLVNAVLLDPYPYRDSKRLINISFSDKQRERGTIAYTIPDFLEMQKNSKTLEDVAARTMFPMIATGGLPENVSGVGFSPNAFQHFGVPAMLGRTFASSDVPTLQDPPRIAVISYLFWKRHFNSDPGIVGKTLELDHQAYTVLGVVPPRFTWNDGDVYVPMALVADPHRAFPLMAHSKPGVSFAAVSAELQAMTERFAKSNPDAYPKDFQIHVESLNDFLLGRFAGTLLILLVAVAFLLLIACGNVSILLLARAAARQKEMAVRLSLGASRGRVLQQLLTESVLLSLTGGLLGVLAAYRGVDAIVALMPQYSVPHEAAIAVNGPVVLFTFAVSVLTGILFGLAPALQLAKSDVNQAMQDGGKGTTSASVGGRMRAFLIVGQVALTMVLLVGAGVAIRGFIELTQVPLGYRPENVLSINLNLPKGRYNTWVTRGEMFQRVLDGIRSVPGAKSAAMTETAMPPYIGFQSDFDIAGRAASANQKTQVGLISGDYFATVGVPLLRGRLLSDQDVQRGGRYAVINDEMARIYFSPGNEPIGQHITVPELKFKNPDIFTPPAGDPSFEIVGVVATARNQGLRDNPKPAIYVPYTMAMVPGCSYLIRTAGDPHQLVNAIREQVRTVDADQPVTQIRTLEELLHDFERAYPRFSTTLFSIFGAVALLLASTGMYSLVSYTVSRRTHEFGIRMALGARPRDVLLLVIGTTARLMAAGIAIGLAASLALSSVTARYISGWNPKDPMAFAAVILVLTLVALLASWLPAHRATKIEPTVALRHE
jgi:predicted permease